MSLPRLRPLGFGEILDEGFTLYRRNFTTFFATALVCVIPVTLISRAFEGAMVSPELTTPAEAAALLLLVPVTMLLWSVLLSALTHETADAYEGRQPAMKGAYLRALRALPAIVAAWILIAALGTALMVVVSIVAAIAVIPAAAVGGDGGGAVFGTAVALVAMGVMLLAFTSLFALFPAIVIERLGPWAGMKRSHTLAKGGRLRIAGIILVTFLIVMLPTLGLMAAAGMGAAMWDVTAAATLSPVQRFTQQFVTILASALTTPFMVTCLTLLYFDRRVRVEGYDLEAAAEALAADVHA